MKCLAKLQGGPRRNILILMKIDLLIFLHLNLELSRSLFWNRLIICLTKQLLIHIIKILLELQKNSPLILNYQQYFSFIVYQINSHYLCSLIFKQLMRAEKKFRNRSNSRQIIKKQLMQNQYHIPRQNIPQAETSHKSQASSKFLNTLQFLDYNLIQSQMLNQFEQKLEKELRITPFIVQLCFQNQTKDLKLQHLVKKLVDTDSKLFVNHKDLIFEIKGITATGNKIVQQITNLFIYLHFINNNRLQYKSILRQFHQKKIDQNIHQIGQENSILLTSKILSIVFMIAIKYNDHSKLFKLGQTTISLRRKVQAKFFNREYLNVNNEYVRTTFYFSLKYMDSFLKQNQKSYQLILSIQSQSKIAKFYYDRKMINSDEYELLVDQLKKIKKFATQNIQQDYYLLRKPIEQKLLINKMARTQSALKQFKLRRSFTKTNKKNDFESFFKQQIQSTVEVQHKNIQADKDEKDNQSKNFRFVYENPCEKNLKKFVKYNPQESKLKKIRNDKKKSYIDLNCEERQTANNTKIIITTMQQLAKQTFNFDYLDKNKDDKDTMTLLSRLKSMTLLSMNEGKNKQSAEILKKQKKKKIQKIYAHFSNETKIIRDIPMRKIAVQFSQIKKMEIGKKQFIKDMLRTQIVNFSAGLKDNVKQFNLILNNKGCLQLQFIKIWLDNLYICHVRLEINSKNFMLFIKMNGKLSKIKLYRGNNVLCQRYLTIWPTIRYLVYKKLIQFNLFRQYEHYLIIKKLAQKNLIELENQCYQSKFGFISQEEIEQINICLDNIFKLLLIIEHFYSRAIRHNHIQISKQYKLRLNVNPQNCNGYHLKLNFLTQIFLNQVPQIQLCSFCYSLSQNYFFVKILITSKKLLNIINNKSDVQLIIKVSNLQSFGQTKTTVDLTWNQLQCSLIIYDNFTQFAIAKCSKINCNQNFTSQFLRYIAQRIIIEKHPIFQQSINFNFVVNQQYMSNYKHSNIKIQNDASFNYCNRFILTTIENYQSIRHMEFIQGMELSSRRDGRFTKQNKMQSASDNFQNINKSTKINEKSAIKIEKKQNKILIYHKLKINHKLIWKQERKLKNRTYLFQLYLIGQTISQQWIAEYIMTNKKNQAKHSFHLNHLDILQVYISKYKQQIGKMVLQKFREEILKNKLEFLIKLINFLDFYSNHHISKVYLLLYQKLYRYSNNNKNKFKNTHVNFKQMYNGNNNPFYNQPLLEQFQIFNDLRIVKPIKIVNKFGLLTIKRNFIHDQPFWEIILQFPRKHNQHIYQLSQQKMISFITNSRNNQKAFRQRKNNYIFPQSQVHFSLSIQQSFNKQQEIDYKSKILKLFEKSQIFIIKKQHKYRLNFCNQQYELQERIIEQIDLYTGRLYNVLLDGQFIKVNLIYYYQDITDSVSLNIQPGFLKNSRKQVIGRIKLEDANIIYDMQNKDTNEQNFYLTRVSQFYLQYCKHLINKQERQ